MTRPRGRRVLIVDYTLQPPGGGGAIGSWMIEGLKTHHAVTVLTWTPLDVASINRYFGTAIAPSEIVARRPPTPVWRALEALGSSLITLKMAILVAIARRLAGGFDVLISPDGEADFGRRAIQYVNLPGRYQWRGLPQAPVPRGRRLAVAAYRALVDRVAPVSLDRLRRNVSLVNSDWTGARLHELLGCPGLTLYPPVAGEFEDVPWQAREAAFVCIGRMAPDKRLDLALDVVNAVRARHPGLRLHLVSPPGGDPDCRRGLLERIAAADWITLHQDLPRPALCRLVSHCRYGIHATIGEPFGMAVGEMVRGGCVVWVPRVGGVAEIVGGDERLVWGTGAEAADKIARVVGDLDAEARLRAALASRTAVLGADRFVERVRALVAGFPA